MDWLKKAPTAVTVTVIIVCGFLATVLVAAYVVLTLQGADTSEFRQWVQTIGQLLVFPLLGVTSVASVAAARSASKAEDNGNGLLTTRDARIAALERAVQTYEDRLRQTGQFPTNPGGPV